MIITNETITLSGKQFARPLQVAPSLGSTFFTPTPHDYPTLFLHDEWVGTSLQKRWLAHGLIQATPKGAKDQAIAIILSAGGSIE